MVQVYRMVRILLGVRQVGMRWEVHSVLGEAMTTFVHADPIGLIVLAIVGFVSLILCEMSKKR